MNVVESKATATNPPSSGRDELNLIDFPISVLQSKQPVGPDGTSPDELVCTIESYDRHLDRIVPRKLTRRTASKYGFPTPVEEEVLIGLLTLTRIKNNFTSARVRFCNSELYRLLGWPSNGNRNERLRVALDRLKGLTLKYENAWTRGGDKFEKELTTNLLDAYQFVRQTDGDPAEGKETSWIQWASEVFADMKRGNVKELNTDRYFSFSRPISRRLYRILDKQLSDSSSVSIDLHTLAIQLGITGTTHVGKIKERIAPGLKEVEQKGELIEPEPSEKRYTKRGPGKWIAHFTSIDAGATRKTVARVLPPSRRRQRPNNELAIALVSQFYNLWSGDDSPFVTKTELKQAQQVIDRYGQDYASELLVEVVRQLKKSFPAARVFGAANTYWHTADETLRKKASRQETRESINQKLATDAQRVEKERDELDELRSQWGRLDAFKQEQIREAVVAQAGNTVRRFIAAGNYTTPLVERACLNEMKRQNELGATQSAAPSTVL